MSTIACIKIKSRVFMTNEDYERGKQYGNKESY